ncbi:MAG: hypothetical protein RBT33_03080 [Candidatus Dojkabacteria bacterium]|jgi:hypothetical protein|nr:hypothetical protein [Candidatus Dojkabacteria bacterium]
MSTEGYTQEFNSNRERKDRQLYAVNLLLKKQLPSNLKSQYLRSKNIAEWSSRSYILDKGMESEISFLKGRYLIEDNHFKQMISAKEFDLRKRTGAYMIDLDRYFPQEEFNIIDVTYEGLKDDEIFSILRFQDIDDNRIVMVRDGQREYEEDMYDEFYYFLVEFHI